MKLEHKAPMDIEGESMRIIGTELEAQGISLPQDCAAVIKRAIHTTADFDYVDNLFFSEHAVTKMRQAIREGACIVTDTQMARAGISKKTLAKYGGEVFCFMSDGDVAEAAKAAGSTRAAASMDKAASLEAQAGLSGKLSLPSETPLRL